MLNLLFTAIYCVTIARLKVYSVNYCAEEKVNLLPSSCVSPTAHTQSGEKGRGRGLGSVPLRLPAQVWVVWVRALALSATPDLRGRERDNYSVDYGGGGGGGAQL